MEEQYCSRRRPVVVGAAVLAASLTLTGCQARPGDAPTVQEPRQTTTTAPADADDDRAEELRTVTVGVDDVPTDLNPHLVGSRSTATSVVAALTLPSAFTALPGEEHRSELNTDLLTSVTVTEGEPAAPTAVRYEISAAAQWSDGTPVTGSDFEYLRQQMTTAPGVAAPADYAAVERIDVTAGGRTVDVTFTRPDPDWRELFSDLLPSHIYRSEDRDFSTMMEGVPAASGGVFRVRAVDTTRGVIELERNERFWGQSPARTDKLVLSEVPDTRTGAQMLRNGQLQMLVTGRQGVTGESLSTVPGVQVRTMTRPAELTLTFNTTSPRTSSAANRAVIADAVDADSVARIVSGDPGATAPDPLPAGEGSGGTSGGTTVDTADGTAGESRRTRPSSAMAPVPTPDSGLSPLRIGADSTDDTAVEAARRVVDQLTAAGIDATVVTRPSSELYGAFLPSGEVDAVVAWQEPPTSLTSLRSRYGCDTADRAVSQPTSSLPPVTATPATSTPATSTPAPTGTGEPTDAADLTSRPGQQESVEPADPSAGPGTAATTTAPQGEDAAPDEPSGRSENISGLCSAAVDAAVDAGFAAVAEDAVLYTGDDVTDGTVQATLGRVRELVGRQHIDVPLMEDSQVIAVGRDLVGPSPRLADWALDRETGPFVGAGVWRRTGAPGSTGASTGSSSQAPGKNEQTHEQETP